MIRYGLRPPMQRLVPQRQDRAATEEPAPAPERPCAHDRRSARTVIAPAGAA
ncbi:hypothetical protein [Nonomuraea sp. LPB2021202275-12-8]|uniref:hypothetical protein n=1 Tax=Nonomuraea sp. LPB2021202275-12-8 TaxID=3120159 RepID=UPI00300CD078